MDKPAKRYSAVQAARQLVVDREAQPLFGSKPYDVMQNVVVKAGIRDRMIEDMRKALEDIASWRKVAKQQEFSRGAKGAEEHAAKALERFRRAWSQL